MRRHSNLRKYTCDACGLVLKSQETLRRHKWTHMKEKPYICEHCGKGFASTYNLKNHVRVHTGEKPYKCDICHIDYAHKVSLNAHLRSAHGVKPKPCAVAEYDDDVLKGSAPPTITSYVQVSIHEQPGPGEVHEQNVQIDNAVHQQMPQGDPGHHPPSLEDPAHPPKTLEDLLAAVAQHVEDSAAQMTGAANGQSDVKQDEDGGELQNNNEQPQTFVVENNECKVTVETVPGPSTDPSQFQNQFHSVHEVMACLAQDAQQTTTPGTYTVPVSLTVPSSDGTVTVAAPDGTSVTVVSQDGSVTLPVPEGTVPAPGNYVQVVDPNSQNGQTYQYVEGQASN